MKSWEELCFWLAPSGRLFQAWFLVFHPLWSLSTVSQSPDDLVKARMMASGEVGNPTNLKYQCGPVPSISYVTSKHSLRSYSMIKFFFQHHANYLLYNFPLYSANTFWGTSSETIRVKVVCQSIYNAIFLTMPSMCIDAQDDAVGT